MHGRNYYLKGSLLGVLAIFLVVIGWICFIGNTHKLLSFFTLIPFWIGILTCLLIGRMLDHYKSQRLKTWGPIVFTSGAFTYSFSYYLIDGVILQSKTFMDPFKSFFLDQFIGLIFTGIPLSLIITFAYKVTSKK
jgi:hypothetical protein